MSGGDYEVSVLGWALPHDRQCSGWQTLADEEEETSIQKLRVSLVSWLTSVILATPEAEIRIGVGSQPRQIVHATLSQKYPIQNRAG
jgi:hypothetical protein